MRLEVRYGRSFLLDLKQLDPDAYLRIRQFVFEEFPKLGQLQDLPELCQLGFGPLFYRFTLDNYLVGIEMTGHFIKFIRILPKPET